MISKICFDFSMTTCANDDVWLVNVLVYICIQWHIVWTIDTRHVDLSASDNDVECIIMFECSPSMQWSFHSYNIMMSFLWSKSDVCRCYNYNCSSLNFKIPLKLIKFFNIYFIYLWRIEFDNSPSVILNVRKCCNYFKHLFSRNTF